MNSFKVLTLNIHKGFSAGNRRYTLENIRSKLRQTDSNIVFLQEVIGENEKHQKAIPNWPEKNQFEFLADTVWDHYAYGKNAIYQHGHHGNAILSELPFISSNNIDVSTMSVSQRGILHGILENQVHVLCVHFGLFESERRKQVADLINHIDQHVPHEAALILAGDFNDWRKISHRKLIDSCNLVEAHEAMHNQPGSTFPAFAPLLPMDRIYVRGFKVSNVEVLTAKPWRALSDHCALTTELTLSDHRN